ETLEEIKEQNREIFLHAGGEKFEYIPALNDDKAHIDLLEQLVSNHVSC
ncbi:ferrochelatase, partial [Yersinia enterocolitica]